MNETTPLEDPADATVDECIDEMNNEMAKDIAHHLGALERKRPGESAKFLKKLAGIAALTLSNAPSSPDDLRRHRSQYW